MNTRNPKLSNHVRQLPLIGVALIAMAGGCEHRISQHQLMAMLSERAAVPTTQPAKLAPSKVASINHSLGPFVAGPDDVLAVTVTPSTQVGPAWPVQARVDEEGFVDLPMVGKVQVKGLTLGQIESAVQKAYVPDFHRQASVNASVLQASPTDVVVLGTVSTPGLVSLGRNESNLLVAMARAGGASMTSSGKVTLQRLREPGQPITLDLRSPEQLQEALLMEPLSSGDIVTVEAADPNMIFVGGLVNMTSPQVYPPGTQVTVLQAIAAAGGVRMDLLPGEATLIRRIDGKEVFVELDLNRIAKGKEDNLQLAAGDILWVPHTAGTRVLEFINNTIYFRAGASYNASYSDSGANYRGDLKDAEPTTVLVP